MSICAGATMLLLACLPASPAAAEELLQVYQSLAKRHLRPAPLVFTSAPPSIAPIERMVQNSSTRIRSGYTLRLVHYGPFGPDAIVALEGGEVRSLGAGLAEARRLGARFRPTTVRGHRGYLLRRPSANETALLWREDGRVYRIGTGTPRKVSLSQLRGTAAGLEHLGRSYVGQSPAPGETGAVAVTTEHTVSLHLEWGVECLRAGVPSAGYGGSADVALQPVRGGAFSFDLARHTNSSPAHPIPWTGTVSGAISGNFTLSLRIAASVEGASCDSGPLSFALRPG